MVGIDVVDMNCNPAYQHRDYLRRISTSAERQWVLDSPRPDQALSQLWAAKEATYKALDASRPFRPAQISVHWRSRSLLSGEAQWGNARTHVIARTEETCTYAIAIRAGSKLRTVKHTIFPLPGRPAAQSEAALRAAASLLRLLGIPDVSIARDPNGRPYLPGRPEVSVSWSHDGDWIAAIAAVEEGVSS